MAYTDKDIPINCAECEEVIEGVQEMFMHILEAHPTYSAYEAENHARIWADDTYAEIEREREDFNKDRKEEDRAD